MLYLNCLYIQHLLPKITEDDNQNATTRNEAQALHKEMCRLETAFLCNVEYNFRESRFQRASTALQATEIDLCDAVDLVRSLTCQVFAVNLTLLRKSQRTRLRQFVRSVRQTHHEIEHEHSCLDPQIQNANCQAGPSFLHLCSLLKLADCWRSWTKDTAHIKIFRGGSVTDCDCRRNIPWIWRKALFSFCSSTAQTNPYVYS